MTAGSLRALAATAMCLCLMLARPATAVPVPVPAAEPHLRGATTFGCGPRSYRLDLGRLFTAVQSALGRGAGPGAARQLVPATDLQVQQLAAILAGGERRWLPNLQSWFHFQYRAVTPDGVPDRVAGLMERFLGQPENVAAVDAVTRCAGCGRRDSRTPRSPEDHFQETRLTRT